MPSPVLAARTAYAFFTLVRNPDRLDVVFALIDSVIEQPQAQRELDEVLANPHIAAAARARLRAPDLELDKLRALPEGSVGRIAGAFFVENELDPAALPATGHRPSHVTPLQPRASASTCRPTP